MGDRNQSSTEVTPTCCWALMVGRAGPNSTCGGFHGVSALTEFKRDSMPCLTSVLVVLVLRKCSSCSIWVARMAVALGWRHRITWKRWFSSSPHRGHAKRMASCPHRIRFLPIGRNSIHRRRSTGGGNNFCFERLRGNVARGVTDVAESV